MELDVGKIPDLKATTSDWNAGNIQAPALPHAMPLINGSLIIIEQ
jgi:hypothetical protein